MRMLALVAAMALMAGTATTQTQPSAAELRAGLAGSWSGALGYRDYQSNELFEIPVTTTITLVADGVTQIRRSLFDDGPDKPVWITTVSLDDPAAGSVTSSSYRAGRAVELTTQAVSVAAYVDPKHWSLIYERIGQDGESEAEIRVTETRDLDELLEIKEVRPVGSNAEWAYRNQTRLTRVSD